MTRWALTLAAPRCRRLLDGRRWRGTRRGYRTDGRRDDHDRRSHDDRCAHDRRRHDDHHRTADDHYDSDTQRPTDVAGGEQDRRIDLPEVGGGVSVRPGLRAEHDVPAHRHRLRPLGCTVGHDRRHRRSRRTRPAGRARPLPRCTGRGGVHARWQPCVRVELRDVRAGLLESREATRAGATTTTRATCTESTPRASRSIRRSRSGRCPSSSR